MSFLAFRTPQTRGRIDTRIDNYWNVSRIAEVLTEPDGSTEEEMVNSAWRHQRGLSWRVTNESITWDRSGRLPAHHIFLQLSILSNLQFQFSIIIRLKISMYKIPMFLCIMMQITRNFLGHKTFFYIYFGLLILQAGKCPSWPLY